MVCVILIVTIDLLILIMRTIIYLSDLKKRLKKMLRIANQIRRKKAFENKWLLYDFIDKNPGFSQYDMKKKIGWSIGKIAYYVGKLVKEDMIKNYTEIVNGRTRKSYYGKSMKKFINWDEMRNF